MKTMIIGAVVAAIIVFAYQSLSWTVLPTHKHSLKYTPESEKILAVLSETLPQDGMYAVPHYDPDNTTQEQAQELYKSWEGKPWAFISYHKKATVDIAPQMICGFLLDLVAALMVVWVLWAAREKFTGFGSRFMVVLAFAIFTVFQSSLMGANWMQTPSHYFSGEIIDALVGWALGGMWLAWWVGRNQTA
ncbi:MAG: hypothetical protein ABI623_07445 [bacterium]